MSAKCHKQTLPPPRMRPVAHPGLLPKFRASETFKKCSRKVDRSDSVHSKCLRGGRPSFAATRGSRRRLNVLVSATDVRNGSLADIGGLHNQRLLCAQSARFSTRFLYPLSAISAHRSRYRIKLLLKKNLKCEPWATIRAMARSMTFCFGGMLRFAGRIRGWSSGPRLGLARIARGSDSIAKPREPSLRGPPPRHAGRSPPREARGGAS